MVAYHGTVVEGLSVLKPFANPYSNLDCACVYMTSYKPLAALYIWNKHYRWMNYGFADDGLPLYTESFPSALKEFYGGVSGCIYACEGNFEYNPDVKIKIAVVSQNEVPIREIDVVENCYDRIIEYENKGLIHIRRFGELTDAERDSERRMILSTIKRENLTSNDNHPMAAFVREKFSNILILEEAKNA